MKALFLRGNSAKSSDKEEMVVSLVLSIVNTHSVIGQVGQELMSKSKVSTVYIDFFLWPHPNLLSTFCPKTLYCL